MCIPRSHGATGQQSQLERPRSTHDKNCDGTQQRGKQQIETERDPPMNAEERGIGCVQVLQDKNQHDHRGDDGDRNKRPRDGGPSRWNATLKASGPAITWLWDFFEWFSVLIWCAHGIEDFVLLHPRCTQVRCLSDIDRAR